jgi:CBS domain-containing protein
MALMRGVGRLDKVCLQARGTEQAMREAIVEDVMTAAVITLSPDDSLGAAAALLARNGISGAPVMEGGRVIGILSESDIVRGVLPPAPSVGELSVLEVLSHLNDLGTRTTDKSVSEVMHSLVVDIPPNASVWQAVAVMQQRGIKRLPVVDADGKLVGIISRADILRILGGSTE